MLKCYDIMNEIREKQLTRGIRYLTVLGLFVASGQEGELLNQGCRAVLRHDLMLLTLQRAVVSSQDIVVLTRLPNDLPLVGGTITAELQTPLAHVNVAARARGTPNLALRDADTDPRITELLGKLVRFEVTVSGFTLEEASKKEARAYWDSQAQVIRWSSLSSRTKGVCLT